MKSLLGFVSLFAKRSGPTAVTICLSLVAVVAGVGLLGVSGWFLTGAALTTAGLAFNLFGPSSLVRALSFIRIGARYGEKLVGHDVTLGLLGDIREWLFQRLIPRAPFAGGAWRHGDLVSRLVADVEALDIVFITAVGPGLTVLASGALVGSILAMFVPCAAIVFGAGYVTSALLVPLALVSGSRRIGARLVDDKAALRIAVLDGIEGHTDILTFERQGRMEAIIADAAGRLAEGAHSLNRFGAAASAAVLFVAGVTGLGVLLCGLEQLHSGAIGGPLLVGLVLSVLASFEAVALMIRSAGKLATALAAADRLKELASAPPLISDPDRPEPIPKSGSLIFQDVWFSRRPERSLLKGVNLVCPAGSRTAIVGESGCGKSTLLDLALRLVEPETGCVRVAGMSVSSVAQDSLHARVALMSQSTPVFLGTIADNLKLGRPDADATTLWEALRRVGLDDFVARLPNGLATWCGEGGRTFSGGQARRLCLARILLTRADILLLDEPTSGLDRLAERSFFETLPEATAGRTVLLVTHATLPPGAVERVFRLSAGQLTELVDADRMTAGQTAQPATASSARLSVIST